MRARQTAQKTVKPHTDRTKVTLHAKQGKKLLDDAFEIVGTNSLQKHDVWDQDWVRLLRDIQALAQITEGQN
jgi:hypothetical protein